MEQRRAASETAKGTVFVLDDDTGVGRVLRELIESVGLAASVFTDPQAFLKSFAPIGACCLVLDVRMPGMSGLEVQRRLHEHGVRVPIIFLTGYADVPMAIEAMRHGAFDFFQKPFHNQALLDRIQLALDKSRSDLHELRERSVHDARLALLSARERDVLQQVIAGQSSRAIAESLQISPRTVENHRANILRKLHCESTVELVRLFSDAH